MGPINVISSSCECQSMKQHSVPQGEWRFISPPCENMKIRVYHLRIYTRYMKNRMVFQYIHVIVGFLHLLSPSIFLPFLCLSVSFPIINESVKMYPAGVNLFSKCVLSLLRWLWCAFIADTNLVIAKEIATIFYRAWKLFVPVFS